MKIVILLASLLNSLDYFAVGDFQFSPTNVTGVVVGDCHQNCSIWGNQLTYIELHFTAPIEDYQENSSCFTNECRVVSNGKFNKGTLTVRVEVNGEIFTLQNVTFKGNVSSYLIGEKGVSHLELNYKGTLNNQLVTGNVTLACIHRNGCSPGDGLGTMEIQ